MLSIAVRGFRAGCKCFCFGERPAILARRELRGPLHLALEARCGFCHRASVRRSLLLQQTVVCETDDEATFALDEIGEERVVVRFAIHHVYRTPVTEPGDARSRSH